MRLNCCWWCRFEGGWWFLQFWSSRRLKKDKLLYSKNLLFRCIFLCQQITLFENQNQQTSTKHKKHSRTKNLSMLSFILNYFTFHFLLFPCHDDLDDEVLLISRNGLFFLQKSDIKTSAFIEIKKTDQILIIIFLTFSTSLAIIISLFTIWIIYRESFRKWHKLCFPCLPTKLGNHAERERSLSGPFACIIQQHLHIILIPSL